MRKELSPYTLFCCFLIIKLSPLYSGPIIFTSEIEGHLGPCTTCAHKRGGISKRQTIFEQMIVKAPDSILIDTGNLYHGREALLSKGHRTANSIALQPYDALILGHQDLRNGVDHLASLISLSQTPTISANISSKQLTIKPFGNIKGTTIIGLTEIPSGASYLPSWKKTLSDIEYIDPAPAISTVLESAEVKNSTRKILVFNGTKSTFSRKILSHPNIKSFEHVIVAGDSFPHKTLKRKITPTPID